MGHDGQNIYIPECMGHDGQNIYIPECMGHDGQNIYIPECMGVWTAQQIEDMMHMVWWPGSPWLRDVVTRRSGGCTTRV